MIRSLTTRDVELIQKLRINRSHPSPGAMRDAETAVREVFPKLFLQSPWTSPDVPSLISVGENGEADGMLAGVAGRWIHDDTSVLAAVGADFYVTPESRRRMTGFLMLKQFLQGPQDVTICDVANGNTRHIWERMGGSIASLYNLNWVAVFRPVELSATIAARKVASARIGRAAASVLSGLNRLTPAWSRCRVDGADSGISEHELSPRYFAEHLGELTAEDSARPLYSEQAAHWLWSRFSCLSSEAGPVQAVVANDRHGKLLGWYIYQHAVDGVARVFQVAAKQRNFELVLDQLLSRLNSEGATAAIGRLQPRYLQPLLDRRIRIRPRKSFTLIHSRDKKLMDAFRGGTAWLSMLDGEAPFNIWNSPIEGARAQQSLAQVPQSRSVDQGVAEADSLAVHL